MFKLAAFTALFLLTVPASAQSRQSAEEIGWRMFVDAMKPSGNSAVDARLMWETWILQNCLFQAQQTPGCLTPAGTSGSVPPSQRFIRSPLAVVRQMANGAPHDMPPSAGNCNPKTKSGRVICEEARLNPPAEAYVRQHSLQTRATQAAYAAKPGIDFPASAVETKVDWLQYPGTCVSYGNQLQGVYTEEITENGSTSCYALAGIHLSSKLLPDWIWATFEPQNTFTNPQRCVVLGCFDSFGSVPARTRPGSPKQTDLSPRVRAMMEEARLDPVFLNYRMDGAQTKFLDAAGKPTILANSIIEGDNVGMPMKQASCITCHSVSSIAKNGTDGITVLGKMGNPVGVPPALPKGFDRRDFAWSLFLAPSAKNTEQQSKRVP